MFCACFDRFRGVFSHLLPVLEARKASGRLQRGLQAPARRARGLSGDAAAEEAGVSSLIRLRFGREDYISCHKIRESLVAQAVSACKELSYVYIYI